MSKKKSEWSSSESDSEESFSSLSSHSRSKSVDSKSTRKSKDRKTSSRYSDNFSSGSSDIDIKSKKTKTPSFSDTESISSTKSAGSEPNSFKNLIQDNEPNRQLPTKVYQILESLKNSLINVYNLKKTFKENTFLIKQYSTQSSELIANNEKISDLMVQECLGCIALSQVVFGSSHWRYAMAYTELAHVYLEFKNLPKQSKQYCEIAWKILYEELKNKTLHEANKSENQSNNFASITPQVVDKHQMMLNYIYGRACTLLKENDRGLSILEKAEEFYENWLNDLSELKLKFKYKEEICSWKLKIYFALAKQYAIKKSNSNAIEYYDKCIDCFKPNKQLDLDLMFEIYHDKAKIELNKENFDKSADIIKECLQKIEPIGSDFYTYECKLALAKIYGELDEMNSVDKAEDLYKQVLEGHSKLFIHLNEKIINDKNDLIKFYLKQEKFDNAFTLLEELLKNKIEFYGDFSTKLVSSHKLLCSILLKKNDLDNAVKHLQKSLEIEELNYGKKSKQFAQTSETLENLQSKLSKKSEKPAFNPSRKINHFKQDLSLYAPRN